MHAYIHANSQGKHKTEAKIYHRRNVEQIAGIHGETGKWKYGSESWKLRGKNPKSNWELLFLWTVFLFCATE